MWGPQSTRKEGGQLLLLPLVHVKHQQQQLPHSKNLKTQLGTKSHKRIYHFVWFFALDHETMLRFHRGGLCREKSKQQLRIEKNENTKKMN